jgi:hypothetical protein
MVEKNKYFVGSVNIKDDRRETGLLDKIIADIKLPEFYHDVAELEGIELSQGVKYIEKP